MQIFAPKSDNRLSCIFPFDFGMFCATLNVGRAKAACSSHKKVAQSTFSSKTRSEVARALGFTKLSATRLERLVQMPNWSRIFGTVKMGRDAITVAPALFYKLTLGWRDLCAISAFSLTVRAEETRARLAAFVRPENQKVRIC